MSENDSSNNGYNSSLASLGWLPSYIVPSNKNKDPDMLVFFYGLFMDPAKLELHHVSGRAFRRAWVIDMQLRILTRATLVPETGVCTPGVTANVSRRNLELLYAEPGLSCYYPQTVNVRFEDGSSVAATTWIADVNPLIDTPNSVYIAELREARRLYQFPVDDLE